MTKTYRQGDVLLVAVAAIPDEAKDRVPRVSNRIVLAEGEATGHAHAVKSREAVLFRDPELNRVFLQVTGQGVALEHDEHSPVALAPGAYEVVRQVEYSPEEIRRVAD